MIIIDNRERKLIDIFEKEQIEFQVEPLDIGDIIIKTGENELCIERKTIKDLESSVKDGRYIEQKVRLKGTCQFPIYLIENYKSFEELTSICKGAIINSILRDRFHIFFSNSIYDTYSIIIQIYNRVSKDPEKYFSKTNIDNIDYVSISKKKSANMSKTMIYQKQLSLIPGISDTKAKTIIEGTGTTSLYDLIHKIKHEGLKLSAIKNIGPKLETNVINYLL